jgi:alkylation response protein AidB-like acyl-CoA dehydrogenase
MEATSSPLRAEIEYGEEEALIARSAAEFLAKRSDFAGVRAAMATPSGYDRDVYRELAELGWLGLALPAAHGGADMKVSALAPLAEAMGRHVFASPFLASTLAAQALLHAGHARQQQTWLERIARGEAVVAIAISEPSGSFELDRIAAQASDAGGGLVLTGEKTRVLDAQNADAVIVAVERAGELALVLLERAQLEGRMRAETLIDETRRSARIRLDGLSVAREALLDGGDAAAALAHVQRVAWLLLAAEMAGGAEGVMQLTLDYLKTRTQFGKAIGSYQALKHPMVEIMCAIEHGRSLLYHAATSFERSDPEREIALRMAKAQLGETYAYAVDRAIQFHGAIGFTYECHAQLFFRRAQWALCSFGDPAHHRRHLADLMWPVAT